MHIMKYLFTLLTLFTFELIFAQQWEDTPLTTDIWRTVNNGNLDQLKQLVATKPDTVTARSKDGRGGLFWAYEYQQASIAGYLISKGADEEATDINGKKPKDLFTGSDLNSFQHLVRQEKIKADNEPDIVIPSQEEQQQAFQQAGASTYAFDSSDDDDDEDEEDDDDDDDDEKDEL